MVCVLDFKRDVGLWHGILCVSINISYRLATFAPCQLEVKCICGVLVNMFVSSVVDHRFETLSH